MKKKEIIPLVLLLAACGGAGQEEREEVRSSMSQPVQTEEVTVEPFRRGPFDHELVSNGKVEAGHKAELRFESEGVVARIYVKNGDRVQRGQKLAELDKFRLTNQKEQARADLEQARLDLKDVLVGQGYPVTDHTDVPDEVMQLARVKSGYNRALSLYELACHEEERATLTAPFDGIVANLFTREHNQPDATEPFCTLVGNRDMEVCFTVLENELPLIRPGDRVVVTSYADATRTREGKISEINPQVGENGLVTVRARVADGGSFFDGMNVKVSVRRALKDQWVVPKSAVVQRRDRQVVFTLKNGKAQWNYVRTALENSTHYSLSEVGSMAEGDTIIVTGNVNLAHDVAVKVRRVVKKETEKAHD